MYLQNLNNIYPFRVFEVSEAVLADRLKLPHTFMEDNLCEKDHPCNIKWEGEEVG